MNGRKVVAVGAGAVGSTFSYALAQSGLAAGVAQPACRTQQAVRSTQYAVRRDEHVALW